MKKVEAIIERCTDGGYSIYCINEMFSGMGDTTEAAKQNMTDSIDFFVKGCKEDNFQYPKWLDEPYEFVYKFDAQSLLQYYAGVITPSALGRITGINPKQLWSYAHGKSKPRPAQLQKIEQGLHNLAKELSSVSLL